MWMHHYFLTRSLHIVHLFHPSMTYLLRKSHHYMAFLWSLMLDHLLHHLHNVNHHVTTLCSNSTYPPSITMKHYQDHFLSSNHRMLV